MEEAYNAIVRRQWTRYLVPMLRALPVGHPVERETLVSLVPPPAATRPPSSCR
jgi:hypothetical protein